MFGIKPTVSDSSSSTADAVAWKKPKYEYGDLVGWYVDAYREVTRNDPPNTIKGAMARAIGRACKEGHDPAHLKETIGRMIRDGISPASFDHVLMQVQIDFKGTSARDREMIREYMQANGGQWPTGARFARGTHSGTYVWDPLGTDRPPPGYDNPEIHKPSRDEVIAALRKAGDGNPSDV